MRWPTATQVLFSFIATLVALPVERPRALPSLSIISSSSSSYQIVSCFRSPLSLHMHRNSWWTKEKASSNWGRAKIDRPLISLFLYFKWARYTVLHNRHLLTASWESPSCIYRTSIKVGNKYLRPLPNSEKCAQLLFFPFNILTASSHCFAWDTE